MSKQANANVIYAQGQNTNLSRKEIIERITNDLGVSSAYASTLYNNARKAAEADKAPAAPAIDASSFDSIDEAISMKMNKIEKFDRPTLRRFRDTLNTKLAEIEAEFGVTINIGSMRFSSTDFTARLSCALGSADEAAQREWEQNCIFFGLKKDDFGRTFSDRGTPFTVTGIKPKSRKYPVLATNSNGTTYKFPASVLK